MKATPPRPDVTMARHRRLPNGARDVASLHWRNLDAAHLVEGVTTSPRTVIDSCLDLPFDEALSVFDSTKERSVDDDRRDVARGLGSRQRRRVARVAQLADRRAANPFESVLRAIAHSVPAMTPLPQHRIRYDGFFARVDLADPELQIVSLPGWPA